MYIAIANSIYSSTLQGSGGGFPKASFALNFNTIASDFTFTRNSFATRVNENGLIETVTDLGSDLVENGNFDELGSELVTNGDFENGSTDWTENANWSIADGKATSNGSSGNLQQGNVLTANEINTYLVAFDIVEYNSGNVRPNIHGNVSGTPRSAVGTYSEYITGISSANTSLFMMSSSFNGSIDNVSVKQVDPNDDWTIEALWTIQDGVASGNGASGSSQELNQNISSSGISIGSTVRGSFEIKNYVSGSVQVIGISNTVSRSSNGIYEFQGDITSFNIRFRGSIFYGDITNVSIQEVLEDDVPRIDYTGSTFDVPVLGSELITNGNFATDSNWSKQSGWSIANGVATFDINNYSGGNANIYQNCMVSGKEYVLTYDVVDYVQGYVRNVSRSGAIPRTANGTYTEQFVANNGNLFLKADPNSNTILSIDNVSIKEVTAYTTTDKGAFLLEPISTNLLTYSEDFTGWINTSSTDTFGAISPSGLANATTLTDDGNGGASGNVRIQKNGISINATTVYTFSCFLKPNPNNIVEIKTANDDAIRGGAFDLSNETFTPLNSETGNIELLSNDWYKVSVTWTSGSDTSIALRVGFPNITRDGTNSFILWGAQLEELSYASSYIPTSGTTVTRAQESCVDATPTINSLEGVLYVEISALVENDGIRLISLNDGTSGNIVQMYYSNSANKIICQTKVGSATQSSIQYVASSQTDTHKVAFKYKENDFALWVDGVEIGTDLVGSVWAEGTLNQLDFDIGTGSLPFYGRTKDLKVYDKALTDGQLIELTTI